jgi:hypothetical protein
MESLISANGNPSGNGSSQVSQDIIERAMQSANPTLWLQAYEFYMAHSENLSLSKQEAMEWADVDVTINTEARQEFGLPPAQPDLREGRHAA